ncbi:unnamed protein product, partial [Vitis vinifera]
MDGILRNKHSLELMTPEKKYIEEHNHLVISHDFNPFFVKRIHQPIFVIHLEVTPKISTWVDGYIAIIYMLHKIHYNRKLNLFPMMAMKIKFGKRKKKKKRSEGKDLVHNLLTQSSDLRIKSLDGVLLLLLQNGQSLLQLRFHLLPPLRQLHLYFRRRLLLHLVEGRESSRSCRVRP